MDLRNGFDIKRYIRTLPDYPKKGIMFRDITTLLADAHGFRATIDELMWPFLREGIDYVVGIEARGFILGGAVAHELGKGFIPFRKKGKLPFHVIGRDYELEYGVDTMEVHADAMGEGDRVLIIDDLIATGGTAAAAIDLVQATGAEVVAAAFIVDLPDLGGSKKLRDKGVKLHTLVEFEGE